MQVEAPVIKSIVQLIRDHMRTDSGCLLLIRDWKVLCYTEKGDCKCRAINQRLTGKHNLIKHTLKPYLDNLVAKCQ